MDARNLPDALKAIMDKQGWTQSDLARELGVSQTWVSQASRGDRDPGIARTADYLGRIGWEVRITPKAERGPVNRRSFMTAAASVVIVPSVKGNPFQDPKYVRALADRSVRIRDELGGVPVISTGLRDVRRVEPAVNSHDRELQEASSELAGQTALNLYDARRLEAAEKTAGLALALASRSGSHDAQARSFKVLSLISAAQGHRERAAMYAHRGLTVPDICDMERALLSARLGRYLALIPGQERKARVALEHAGGVTNLPPLYEAEIAGNVGIALDNLRAHDQADAFLLRAARFCAPSSPLCHALYLGHQVHSALHAGEPEVAADRMHALARVAPLVTSSQVNEQMSGILTASERWATVPVIRDARDQLRGLLPKV
ncbi:helix-turn-helix transcriptional regulator [Actinomadura alba]|uniref:helix-turn-helix domain-containing protein n=1 Tax=Actinomadura alba TaxID=406431 RepID=UPI0031E41451